MSTSARTPSDWPDRLGDALGRRFGVDPRALAAMRVALGAVLLLDLALRARELTTFYADGGVLPRSALAAEFPTYRSLSLHAVAGDAWVQALLFGVAGAFALALLLGYRTRLATVASLVLLVSLHARNPMVLNAGDVLLRRLLFWGCFLPLGSRWALDARRTGLRRNRVAGLATAGLLLQIALVYATNLPFKLSGDAWLAGDALGYVLALETYTVGLGPVLAGNAALLAALTWGWFVLILASPLLLVVTGRARTGLAAAFAAGHVGMLLTMDLGVFPLVSLVALVPFLGRGVWERVDRHAPSAVPRVARWLPTTPTCSLPERSEPWVGRTRTAVLSLIIAILLLWNAVAVGVVDAPEATPDAVDERSWNMFGNPPRAEAWYVARARYGPNDVVAAPAATDGSGGPPGEGGRYPAARWRKYQADLSARDDDRLYRHLAGDVCRRWSGRGDGSVRSVTLERVTERTRLDGPDERSTEVIGRYDCPTRADGA